jgi:hypothetical protein
LELDEVEELLMLLSVSQPACRIVALDRIVPLLRVYQRRAASPRTEPDCAAVRRDLGRYRCLFRSDHLLGAFLIYSTYRELFPDDPITTPDGGLLVVPPLNRDELITWSNHFPTMGRVVFGALASIDGPRDSEQDSESEDPERSHSVITTIIAQPGNESCGETHERGTPASSSPVKEWCHPEDNPRYPFGDARTEGNLIELAQATESCSGQGSKRKPNRRALQVRARNGVVWIRKISRERYRVSFEHKDHYERAVRLLQELRDKQVPSNRGGPRSKSSSSDRE